MTDQLFVAAAHADTDAREVLAVMVGADFSARAITPQRSDRAPDIVRAALARFAPFDARHGTDLAAGWCVVDHGNAGAIRSSTWADAHAAITTSADAAWTMGPFIVGLGGDHSVSWPLVEVAALHCGRMGVIQLDVHHDVRPLVDGPSNGTPFRGLIESGVLRGADLVQVGIHPFGNRPELTRWCDEQGILRYSLEDVRRRGVEAVVDGALARLADVDAIYLSVDIDVLGRAHAPGTAAALPGGLEPHVLCELVEGICAEPRTRAMDVVEFDPERDVADITAYAAANVIIAGLAAVARQARATN